MGASNGHLHGTAMAANWHHPWWTALLWNPDTVHLADGSYPPFGAPDYWHGCATACSGYATGDLPRARATVDTLLAVPFTEHDTEQVIEQRALTIRQEATAWKS